MALVLVEGEEQIAKIVNASNTSTDATNDSTTSQVNFDAHRHATMVTALGLLLILLQAYLESTQVLAPAALRVG